MKTVCVAAIGIYTLVFGNLYADDSIQSQFHKTSLHLSKAAEEAGTIAVKGLDSWLFLANELRHVTLNEFWGENAAKISRAARAEDADPLPAILDFNSQLAELGIELIIVPVPPKAIIYPDKITLAAAAPPGETPKRLDPAHQRFYDILRENGVQVLDLTEEFHANRDTASGTAYCRQDSHWSVIGCRIAATNIASLVEERPWFAGVPKVEYDSIESTVHISGDLWNSLDDPRPERESITLRRVGVRDGDTITPVRPDTSSPVILLGDSHTLVFHAGGDMHAAGSGLADQLALELGFVVDVVGVRGSGATPARINLFRRGRAEPGYFQNKKIVIWCFSAREFSESQGWRLVPVVR